MWCDVSKIRMLMGFQIFKFNSCLILFIHEKWNIFNKIEFITITYTWRSWDYLDILTRLVEEGVWSFRQENVELADKNQRRRFSNDVNITVMFSIGFGHNVCDDDDDDYDEMTFPWNSFCDDDENGISRNGVSHENVLQGMVLTMSFGVWSQF